MTKKIFSWALYDWANSVFFTTVMSGFFPVFFKQYWGLGVSPTLTTARLGLILSISGFVLAILSPTLGVLSDKKRLKKKLLFITMCMGSLFTLGLFFVQQGDWATSALLYGIALFMCSASCVFYDSLMMSVCHYDQVDFVSAFGFSLGYLGGGLLFSLNVVMFLNPQWFGIANPIEAVKWSFVTVAVWWFVFTMPLMFNVSEPATEISNKNVLHLTQETFYELKKTIFEIFQNKKLFYFLIAYWFYIDGVFTVMSMAVDFGMSIGLDSSELIKALLITQFVGFPSAYLFGFLAKYVNNTKLILFSLFVYAVAIMAASQMTTSTHFYILAITIGFAQGAVQALSRSQFAKLIPKDKTGEYFGFYNLLGKFASILGPALIAIAAHITSDSRKAILSLLLLIGIGGACLYRVQSIKLINETN